MNAKTLILAISIFSTGARAGSWTVDSVCELVTDNLLYSCSQVNDWWVLKGIADDNAEVVAEALMRLATNGMVSAETVERDAYTYALDLMGDFGGTNAIPFLLGRIAAEGGRNRSAAVSSYVTATRCSTNELHKLIELIDDGRSGNKGFVEDVFDWILRVEPDPDLPEEKRAAYVAFVEENAFKYDVSPDFQWADKYLCKYRPGWPNSTNRLAVANRIVALPNVHPRTFDYFTAVVASFAPQSTGEE